MLSNSHRIRNIAHAGIIALELFPSAAEAATRFVSPCGQDGWLGLNVNCAAPLGPKRTIQAAINASVNGDTVMVLPGMYIGTIDLDGKAITLTSASGAATTIIDGNGVGPVVTCNSLEGSNTVIDGFTIRDGHSEEHGGGMFIALASPTVSDCVFENNTAEWWGGGMFAVTSSSSVVRCTFHDNTAFNGAGAFFHYGQPEVSDCSFNQNQSELWGGGLALYDCGGAVVTSSNYADNSAHVGGGLYAAQGDVSVADCEFTGNLAFTSGGGMYMYALDQITLDGSTFDSNTVDFISDGIGGALTIANCSPSLSDCTFDSNTAYLGGGAISCENSSGATLSACTFSQNENLGCCGASAVRCVDSTLSMVGCNFDSNSVSQYGGAISAHSSNLALTLCGFHDNLALDWIAYGAAINLYNSSLEAGLTTFVNNQAGGGSGGGGGAVYGHQTERRVI